MPPTWCARSVIVPPCWIRGSMVALGTPGEAVRAYREHLLRRQEYVDAAAIEVDAATTAAGTVGY